MKRSITPGQIIQLAYFLQQALRNVTFSEEGMRRFMSDGPAVQSFKTRLVNLVREFCFEPEPDLPVESILWCWSNRLIASQMHPADAVEGMARHWDVDIAASGIISFLKAVKRCPSGLELVAVRVSDLNLTHCDISSGWVKVSDLQHCRLKYGWHLCPARMVLDLLTATSEHLEPALAHYFMIDPIKTAGEPTIYGLRVTATENQERRGAVQLYVGSEELALSLSDVVVFASIKEGWQ